MKRACSCGKPIHRGRRGRMAGAGLAQYWVVTIDADWRHLDGTMACEPPGLTRIRKRAS